MTSISLFATSKLYALQSLCAAIDMCYCLFFNIVSRKHVLKYCYECGRSVNVKLTACTRCKEVYFCSKLCKTKAWTSRHRYECLRVGSRLIKIFCPYRFNFSLPTVKLEYRVLKAIAKPTDTSTVQHRQLSLKTRGYRRQCRNHNNRKYW